MFAQSPLVIGYNASSKFAAEFKTKPWYQVLQEPGIKIGRTAPTLDPKGALTVTLLKRAETFYKSPGFSENIIGRPSVPEDLEVPLLQSGALDVGFFYSTETADAKMPTLSLPPTRSRPRRSILSPFWTARRIRSAQTNSSRFFWVAMARM